MTPMPIEQSYGGKSDWSAQCTCRTPSPLPDLPANKRRQPLSGRAVNRGLPAAAFIYATASTVCAVLACGELRQPV